MAPRGTPSVPVSSLPGLGPERLERLGAAALELHRDGRQVPVDQFCKWAFERLRRVVRFDSGMWGHGHADPVVIHDVYVENQPPEMMENYAHFQDQDFFAAGCNARPRRTVNLYDLIERKAYVELPIYRRHAVRFGMEQIICTVAPEPLSGLLGFISLWRTRYDDPYDEEDRLAKQFLMPHLTEARRQNMIEHLHRAFEGQAAAESPSAAVCDPQAILHECEPGFAGCVQAEWPQWCGPKLPKALARLLVRHPAGRFEGRSHVFEWSPVELRRLVTARPVHVVDQLSRREREVAALLVEGLTHKEIAARLGLSPNTARTHIYLLYRRLGVSNKAQAIQLFTSLPGTVAPGLGPRALSRTPRPDASCASPAATP